MDVQMVVADVLKGATMGPIIRGLETPRDKRTIKPWGRKGSGD